MFPGRINLDALNGERVKRVEAGFYSTILFTSKGNTYLVGNDNPTLREFGVSGAKDVSLGLRCNLAMAITPGRK